MTGDQRRTEGTQRLADGESTVHRTVLAGGLRVITESLPAVRSASFGRNRTESGNGYLIAK